MPAASRAAPAGMGIVKGMSQRQPAPGLGEAVEEPKMPKDLRPQGMAIIEITDAFCLEHLDDHYAQLCRVAVGKLARKRPSPLLRGDLRIWASGIIYALGSNNFLFDPTQSPHLGAEQLSTLLEVKKTTMANKGRMVRDLLNITMFNTDFLVQGGPGTNPLIWYIEANGLLLDARRLSVETQEILVQKGLIPYAPGKDLGNAPATDESA